MSLSSGFTRIADTTEVPTGTMKKFTLKGKEILVANINGNYYALNSVCTHAGGDLSKGVLEGNVITCPRHKSRFDVTTGKSISGPKIFLLTLTTSDEPVFPVKITGNDILIELG